MLIKREDCERYVENKYGYMYLKEGILYGFYYKNTVLDLEGAKQCYKDRLIISEGKKYPSFIDLTNCKNLTKQARQFIASKEYTDGIVAWAFYTKSPVMRKILYFFLIINKPGAPFHTFSKIQPGIAYLKKFVETDEIKSPQKV